MSRMSELSAAVGELKHCGEILIGVSDTLAALFSGGAEPAGGTPSQEEPKPIKLEAVRAVLAGKSRDGHTAEVRALLERHGASKLSEIDPAEYAALLTEAEGIGNG